MNQILSGVPVESLCLTSGILLSAKSYDTPIRIWQMLSTGTPDFYYILLPMMLLSCANC